MAVVTRKDVHPGWTFPNAGLFKTRSRQHRADLATVKDVRVTVTLSAAQQGLAELMSDTNERGAWKNILTTKEKRKKGGNEEIFWHLDLIFPIRIFKQIGNDFCVRLSGNYAQDGRERRVGDIQHIFLTFSFSPPCNSKKTTPPPPRKKNIWEIIIKSHKCS